MSSKLSGFVDAISRIAKVGDLPILEMDAAAQEVTEEFLRVWITGRIRHNRLQTRAMEKDEVYRRVIEYVVALNSSFFYPRMWSESGIRDTITAPIIADQDLMEFVYRGGSTLYARVFGKSTDSANQSFQGLTKHLCDSLCVMSDNGNDNLVGQHHSGVFPVYSAIQGLFVSNPWLVFIYYLCRIDIFELIIAAKGETK